MIVPYKHNEQDEPILEDISLQIFQSLEIWYGLGAHLESYAPKISSYRNCFMLRYPVTSSSGTKKYVLVKIRRKPKMDSLWQAVSAELHANIPTEYNSLLTVFEHLGGTNDDFGAIRPLSYLDKYNAIIMEEYPSHTLRQLLIHQRQSPTLKGMNELMDAARKTGRWLHYFHHNIHKPVNTPFSTKDVIKLVDSYASPLESYSQGSIKARTIIDVFSQKLENVQIDSVLVSQSHADMTCDNVLYSDDKKVCVIDIKTRPAPIYSDLGLILIHPETFRLQILSGGLYLPDDLLKEYRAAVLAGYFGTKPVDLFFVKLFTAVKVLDKWTMYEELISRYKGIKHLLSFPVGPFVTAYFYRTFMKHLNSIGTHSRNALDHENAGLSPWKHLFVLVVVQLSQAYMEVNSLLLYSNISQ